MLTYVDTLIGFAGVMLLLSLLVTAIVQAAIAVLNLRGENLRWGVEILADKILPELSGDAKKKAEIARAILLDPAVSPDERLATAIRSDELIRLLSAHLARTDQQAHAALQKGQEMGDLKAWFDTVMDRTTERFVAHTRYISVGVAVVLAVVLQIDSLGILKQISGDHALRASLVQNVESTLKLADDSQAHETGLAGRAIKAVIDGKGPGEDLVTRSAGLRWIKEHVPAAERDAVVAAYEKRYDELVQERLKKLGRSADQIEEQLARTQLVVVQVKSWSAWKAWWWKSDEGKNHVVGTLLTIVFLSLGGPFWYNLLRQLANLRPVIAGKVEKDES